MRIYQSIGNPDPCFRHRSSPSIKSAFQVQLGGPSLHRYRNSTMKTVLFACRSNSCRSQMAEGWAREWIRLEKEKNSESSAQRQILERLVVGSVALDAGAVFGGIVGGDRGEQEACCCDPCNTPKQRKEVKSKAITAMMEDGVDISSFMPKTINEVLPKLQPSGSSLSFTPRAEKPIDALIILCSCGDDVKNALSNKSKSVQEWNVDAPTACSKNGEGDNAYRRVSREIKDQVSSLMESILKEESMQVAKCCA